MDASLHDLCFALRAVGRRPLVAQGAIASLATAVTACGDAAGPTRDVVLSFCSGTLWAGVQNEGQGWVTIAGGPADAGVDDSERLVVATMTAGPDPALTTGS